MLHKLFTFIGSILLIANIFAQNPIIVADMSFKPNGSDPEELYYSFAEGDIIVIDLEIVKGKNIKSFEVIELPANIKYSSFKPETINQKQINVSQTGVFLFRIDAGIGGKVCNLKISRIPKDKSTERFNTGWKWKTLYDTTYTAYREDSLVGYDTIPYVETRKIFESEEIREENLLNSTVNIRSYGIIDHDNPREVVRIELPENKQYGNTTEEVVAWAYWISVSDNPNNVFSKNKELIKKAASTATKIPFAGEYTALGGYAVGLVTDLFITDPQKVDNVQYYLVSNEYSAANFKNTGSVYGAIRSGNSSGSYERFVNKDMLQGDYYLCMYNDNVHDRINVNVQVCAIIKTQYFRNEEVQKSKVEPRYVKVERKKMQVTNTRTRVPVE